MIISEVQIAVIQTSRAKGLRVQLHACDDGTVQAFGILGSNWIDPAPDSIDLGFVASEISDDAIREWISMLPKSSSSSNCRHHATTADLSCFAARRRRFVSVVR